MPSPQGIEAGRAFVRLFAADGPLDKTLAQWEGKLANWGTRVNAAGKTLATAGTAVLAPMIAAAASFSATGSRLDDIAQRTGANAAALSTLSYAAQRTGTDLDTVEAALIRTQRATAEAAAGNKTAAASLAAVGLSATALATLSPDQQFRAIATGLAGITDPATRTAAALDLWGKSGAKLLPLANELDALEAEAARLGVTMDAATITAAAELGDAWDRLKAAGGAVTNQIGGALAPALTAISDALATAAGQIAGWIRDNRNAVTVTAALAAGLTATGAALLTAGAALNAASTAIAGLRLASAALVTTWTAAAPLLAALASPIALWGLALAGVVALLVKFTATGQAAAALVGNAFATLAGDLSQTVGGMVDALATGDLTRAAEILWAGLDLVWTRGTGALSATWADWLATLTETFADAWNAIADTMAGMTGIDLSTDLAKSWRTEADAAAAAADTATNAAKSRLDELTAAREKAQPTAAARVATTPLEIPDAAATAAASARQAANSFINATSFEGMKSIITSLRPQGEPGLDALRQIRDHGKTTAEETRKTRETLEKFTIGELD